MVAEPRRAWTSAPKVSVLEGSAGSSSSAATWIEARGCGTELGGGMVGVVGGTDPEDPRGAGTQRGSAQQAIIVPVHRVVECTGLVSVGPDELNGGSGGGIRRAQDQLRGRFTGGGDGDGSIVAGEFHSGDTEALFDATDEAIGVHAHHVDRRLERIVGRPYLPGSCVLADADLGEAERHRHERDQRDPGDADHDEQRADEREAALAATTRDRGRRCRWWIHGPHHPEFVLYTGRHAPHLPVLLSLDRMYASYQHVQSSLSSPSKRTEVPVVVLVPPLPQSVVREFSWIW